MKAQPALLLFFTSHGTLGKLKTFSLSSVKPELQRKTNNVACFLPACLLFLSFLRFWSHTFQS